MAAVVNFSNLFSQQTICFKPSSGLTLGFSPFERPSQLALGKKRREQQGLCLRRLQTDDKPFNSLRLNLVRSSQIDINFTPGPLSASDMIKEFYACINEKKMKEIDGYIAKDCSFEDSSFPLPLQGKKEIMNFFKQLTQGMGNNVKFSIEHVCEDEAYTAGVNWHLEWRKIRIPFTRGCSFYKCSQEGDKLVIKKAWVVTESPIKPGGIALTLLRTVTSFFDDFPKAGEWLLTSPHVILRFLLKIYSRFIAPIINPIISCYLRMWNVILKFLALGLTMLRLFAKKYFGD